jgi:hypothetical protein
MARRQPDKLIATSVEEPISADDYGFDALLD